MKFTHLNVHSKASMLFATADAEAVAKRVKELGQDAVAITDYGNVYEAIPFYKAAKEQGVKPILGATLFFCEDAKELREQKSRDVYHIILLAENDTGWKNITRLISESNDPDHFFYNPRIDFSLLEKYKEGIIVLTGNTRDGVIAAHIPNAPFRAEALVRRFMRIFDAQHFFLEVQNTGDPIQKSVNDKLRELASKYGLKTVATGNVHYVNPADAEAHKALLSIESNQYNKLSLTEFSAEEYYIKSADELAKLDFSEEELSIAHAIGERCNVIIDLKKHRLPKYDKVPDGQTAIQFLRDLCLANYFKVPKVHPLPGDEDYIERLDRELDDIQAMGFADYFLIVYDVINWCRQNGILLGYGRGSVGGSLVAYVLGITEVDPIQYGLIWERFLNRGRGGLPDIDSDVPKSRRQDVLEYIRNRFGKDNVAQIVNYNSLKAKAVLKEVFRIYNMDFEEANKITACVPAKNDDHTDPTLEEALAMSPELRAYEKKYPAWFKIAHDLEGCYKTTGIHAAAVVISDTPFSESPYPLARSKDGGILFGWDMNTVDTLNLLKLDILGLSTLDDIDLTRKLVNQRRNLGITRGSMPLDDPATYAMLGQGFTIGVFQIEKQLGKIWSKALEPENVEELSDLVSLIRPGPMECLHGDTKILIDTKFGNEYKPIKELFDNGLRIALGDKRYSDKIVCVDEDYNFVAGKIGKVVKSGKKSLYKVLVTQRLEGDNSEDTGTQAPYLNILATKNHRFLTKGGWKRLGNIEPGEYIAIMNYRSGRATRKNKHAAGWKNFRNIAFNHYEYKCILCDWSDGSLDVNHIDDSRYVNNTPDNLCFMCPNHHRMYSEESLDRSSVLMAQDDHRLPFTDDVMFVRFDGIKYECDDETYDIVIDGDNHNFIAGGFVVHNSDMHTTYKEIKHGRAQPAYIHESLEPIMGKTKSSLLYQEQVIEICKQLAGMSLIDADKVRKAMGKKKPEEMKKWKEVFVNGCNQNGIMVVTAEEIWGYIEKFAGYGFNKSHGIGYALLSYETAYLKANYTLEFMCAKLIHAKDQPDAFERISALLYDAKLFGIDLTPPRLTNEDFAITSDKTIAFGITALKGVGETAAKRVLSFASGITDFDEFLRLVTASTPSLSTSVMEALIKSGALDAIGGYRVRMLARARLMNFLTLKEIESVNTICEAEAWLGDKWIKAVRILADDKSADELKIRYGIKRMPNVSRREKLREALQKHDSCDLFDSKIQNIVWEKEYLGVSLSGSEADIYNARHKCVDLVKNGEPEMEFEIAVCLDSIRSILTKKGDPMAFVTGRDKTYTLDGIVVFPNTFSKCEHLLEAGNVVKISGKINDRGSYIANTVERLA